MPTAQARPRALRPWRKAAPIPYPASARARPKRTPAATTRSISARAISVLARTRRCSSGTPASAQRSGSLAHSSGRNNLSPSGTGTSSWARVSETRTWQFACLPRAPQYWRATPTERRPFLGKAVSSITSTALGPPTRASAFPARTARKGASSQAGLAMKCCSWSCPPSPRRTASGCRLLRPSGPSRPCRYKGAQRRRVLRPITSKNGASQVSRAASISDDPGSTTPHLLGRCDPRGDGAAHHPLKCPGSAKLGFQSRTMEAGCHHGLGPPARQRLVRALVVSVSRADLGGDRGGHRLLWLLGRSGLNRADGAPFLCAISGRTSGARQRHDLRPVLGHRDHLDRRHARRLRGLRPRPV